MVPVRAKSQCPYAQTLSSAWPVLNQMRSGTLPRSRSVLPIHVTRPGYGRDVDTRSEHQKGRASAEQLAAAIACGDSLAVLSSPVVLEPGELLHARVDANGWRFHGMDVVVEQRQLLAMGGLLTFGIASAANSIGNRRARAEAERLAAPQWRPLGSMPLLATNQRLLAFHEGEWASVWYSAIRQIVPSVDDCRLELIFEDDPPYLLTGEWVPYLTVIITAVLAGHYGVDAVASILQTA